MAWKCCVKQIISQDWLCKLKCFKLKCFFFLICKSKFLVNAILFLEINPPPPPKFWLCATCKSDFLCLALSFQTKWIISFVDKLYIIICLDFGLYVIYCSSLVSAEMLLFHWNSFAALHLNIDGQHSFCAAQLIFNEVSYKVHKMHLGGS